MDLKVEILKYPTDADWMWCKTCTLNTVGKTSAKLPTDEWKRRLIAAEHSPLRELWFGIKMEILGVGPLRASSHRGEPLCTVAAQ